jgi:uroporphyrinogen-III synthase
LTMRVLVTRPLNEAAAWLDGLRAAGHDAVALPLIDISPVTDQTQVRAAWQATPMFQAIMFVSAAAVKHFFSLANDSTRQPLGHTRCWATGLGTRRALLQAGVPEALIDSPPAEAAQFDSEALWRVVAPHVVLAQPVLIVRGTDTVTAPDARHGVSNKGVGRDWLAQTLQNAGIPVRWVVSYQRAVPRWSDAQRRLAMQASADGSVWCFSSSQAISFLQHLMPEQTWSSARCIVTHPRIGEAARALGFGHISLSRPLVDEVVGSLESLA